MYLMYSSKDNLQHITYLHIHEPHLNFDDMVYEVNTRDHVQIIFISS